MPSCRNICQLEIVPVFVQQRRYDRFSLFIHMDPAVPLIEQVTEGGVVVIFPRSYPPASFGNPCSFKNCVLPILPFRDAGSHLSSRFFDHLCSACNENLHTGGVNPYILFPNPVSLLSSLHFCRYSAAAVRVCDVEKGQE